MRKIDTARAETAPGVFVIQLEGEFDIAERARLLDAFAIAETAAVAVVNLERTTYIDSTVLECLVALKAAKEKRGTDLILVGAHQPVLRLFEVTQLDTFFDMRSSLKDLRLGQFAQVRRLTIESRPLT
jgi:anti-anti-sigma factor